MCSHPGTVFAASERGLAVTCPRCEARGPDKPSAKEADEAWEAAYGPRGIREQVQRSREERLGGEREEETMP